MRCTNPRTHTQTHSRTCESDQQLRSLVVAAELQSAVQLRTLSATVQITATEIHTHTHTHTHTHMQTVHSAARPTSPHHDYRLATHTHTHACRQCIQLHDQRHLTMTTGYRHTHTDTHTQTVHSAARPTSPHHDYRLPTHTHRHTHTDRHADGGTTDRQRDWRTDITHLTVTTGYQYTHADRQTDGQTDRETNVTHRHRQTCRRTDRHTQTSHAVLPSKNRKYRLRHAQHGNCRNVSPKRMTFSYADKNYDGNRCSDL